MKKDTESKNTAVNLNNVYKVYLLRSERPTFFDNLLNKSDSTKKNFLALDNISLNISFGERVGIIGLNGSGKTTLLKLIAGIASPSEGKVFVTGKIVSLIDLESGFHPDLTGRENVFLNGAALGMSKKYIYNRFEKITSFSGLGSFINNPLYTYSQGMKLRLGFSIAVFSEPDIFLLDEGVYVGDELFQQKCDSKINEILKNNKTIIFASHWFSFLEKHAERYIWLENGKIIADGGIEVLNNYKMTLKKK